MKFKKYDKVMMETALIWAEESYCERAQVGAVLAKGGRIVSNGYNGMPAGSTNNGKPDNCCEEETLRCLGCDARFDEDNFNGYYICPHCNNRVSKGTKTRKDVIHAEMNAILFAARNGITTEGCTMYVTLSPCIECAKGIVQAGISRVIYDSDYRKSAGVEFLIKNGVETQNINEIKGKQ